MDLKKTITIVFLFLLLLAACSNPTPTPADPQPTPAPTQLPAAEGSNLTIITAFEGQAAYAAAAKADPESDLEALHQQHVVDPIWSQCAEGGELVELAETAVSYPVQDLDGLAQITQTLMSSGIESLVEAAYQRARPLYPGGDTTICVFALDPEFSFVREQMNGVTGLTPGAGKIWLLVYPQESWEEWLAYTVAHEYHHSTWLAKNHDGAAPLKLIDALILEGRADSFARILYPELSVPWTDSLDDAGEKAQWQKIQPILNATSSTTVNDYVFGNSSRDIPVWTGYDIGFSIVQDFLEKAPDLSIEEWSAIPAADLLDQSGYGEAQ